MDVDMLDDSHRHENGIEYIPHFECVRSCPRKILWHQSKSTGRCGVASPIARKRRVSKMVKMGTAMRMVRRTTGECKVLICFHLTGRTLRYSGL